MQKNEGQSPLIAEKKLDIHDKLSDITISKLTPYCLFFLVIYLIHFLSG